MGFRLETATGRSIAIKPQEAHGAPTTINLDGCSREPGEAGEVAQGQTDRKLTAKASAALKEADDARGPARRARSRSSTAPPRPTSCRRARWSSSRATSGGGPARTTRRASLTEPIVRTTLEPVLERLRGGRQPPTPEQILDLKVCDPAMGSGAFLVEACRQLGDALVEAWHAHGCVPDDPGRRGRGPPRPPAGRPALPLRRGQEPDGGGPGEAVALAGDAGQDHPSRSSTTPCGTATRWSGLTPTQIAGVPLGRRRADGLRGGPHRASTSSACASCAAQIREAGDDVQRRSSCATCWTRRRPSSTACGSSATWSCSRASSAAKADGARDATRRDVRATRSSDGRRRAAARPGRASAARGRPAARAVPLGDRVPRGVRARRTPGFDAIVGNPPFAGKNTLVDGNRDGYLDWLKTIHRVARQRRPRGPLLPPRVRPAARRRHLRADRHEHDRPGRHARDRPALDLHARRHDLRRAPAREVAGHGGGGRQRGPRREGRDRRVPFALDGRRSRRSRPTSSTPAATTTRRGSRPTPARASRAASSSAWASRSTTPTRRASPRRSPDAAN